MLEQMQLPSAILWEPLSTGLVLDLAFRLPFHFIFCKCVWESLIGVQEFDIMSRFVVYLSVFLYDKHASCYHL